MLKKTLIALAAVAGFGGAALASDSGVVTTPLSVTQEAVLDAGDLRGTYIYTNDRVNGDVTGDHLFGGEFGLTRNLTVSAASSYSDASSNRFGDVFVNVALDAGDLLGFTIRPALGLNIPNGYDATMAPTAQVSSGSYDLQPALTVWDEDFIGPIGLGAQWVAVFRLDDNANGFNFGDEQTGKLWTSLKASDNVVLYALAQADFVGTPSGLASFLGDAETVSVGGGANVYLVDDHVRLSGEVLIPVHESGMNALNQGRVFRIGLEGTF